jgi:pimeloyl-ACP methyl ester carboxylesterase
MGHRNASAVVPYEVRYYTQRSDHFDSFASPSTWRQRYLFSDVFWDGRAKTDQCRGPILFYTGNEGPIEAFWRGSGFITTTLAPRLGALLLFGEQRYYGPADGRPPSRRTGERYAYLSTEQVLADYATMLVDVKAQLNASSCPVVAVGGSYGGTLTTLFRLKYPHIVVGGLAASAPVGFYDSQAWRERGVDEFTWFRTVERVYAEARPRCYQDLVHAVSVATKTVRRMPRGPQVVQSIFSLCDPPVDVDAWLFWVTEALESIPQIDYPDQEGSMPPNPVNATCTVVGDAAVSGDENRLLVALATVTGWYNGLTAGGCIADAVNMQVGGGTPGDGPDNVSAWGYQSCTETLHPFSVPEGSWRSYLFNASAMAALCRSYYGVEPRLGWLAQWSGGYGIASMKLATNIIWSNGRRDPWHGGGFIRAEDALPGGAVFVMDATAHHQDLRTPSLADPAELTATRSAEEAIIRRWITEATKTSTKANRAADHATRKAAFKTAAQIHSS